MVRMLDAAGWGLVAGIVASVLVMLWITIELLTGPGATAKVLYVSLLFLLPVLGIGALAGWLAGLAVRGVTKRPGRARP